MASNFKKVGNWGAARRLTGSLDKDIKHASSVVMRRIGLEAERKIVKYIQKQPGTWPPLSEEYKQRKVKEGYSQLMLRRTGDYINRITSIFNPAKLSAFVGVRKGVMSKDGEKLWQIGAILEFGRKGDNRTARPHFRPVQKLMNRKIAQERMFEKGVMKYIKSKHSL